MELTKNEFEIINVLRTLKPFEHITIIADKGGRPDVYIVERSNKVVLGQEQPSPIK